MNSKRRGQAMVEFALIVPVLVMLTFGMLDLGRAFYFQEAIANAAREGARHGSTCEGSCTSGMTSAALAEVGTLSGVVVNSAIKSSDADSGSYAIVAVSYEFLLGTPIIQNLVGNSIVLRATCKMPAGTTFGS